MHKVHSNFIAILNNIVEGSCALDAGYTSV